MLDHVPKHYITIHKTMLNEDLTITSVYLAISYPLEDGRRSSRVVKLQPHIYDNSLLSVNYNEQHPHLHIYYSISVRHIT